MNLNSFLLLFEFIYMSITYLLFLIISVFILFFHLIVYSKRIGYDR